MTILAIDTAAQQCAVTVLRQDGVHASIFEPAMRGQPERLLPMISEALGEAGVEYRDLTRVTVTTGPGSFTGLRAGLAAAKGLGLALSIPVIGIDSFLAFETSFDEGNGSCAIVIESRRGELYWRMNGGAVECATIELMAQRLPTAHPVIGDAAWRLAELRPDLMIRDQRPGPDMLAVARLTLGLDPARFPAEPVYVRAPDAVPLPT